MGSPRFLYNNFITAASMLSVSTTVSGHTSNSIKSGTGSAVLNITGAFSGTSDLVYKIEIDSVAGGAEVGQATFKWSDDGGSTYTTGVTTSASAISLSNGVQVSFTTGTGDDFALADAWTFRAFNIYKLANLIDWDRDEAHRSGSLDAPNWIVANLGSAQEVTAIVIGDHNFTSGATITIEANSSDSWGAPAFSEAITYRATSILHYLSSAQTYQYWRLKVADAANGDSYIQIGELFIGDYLQLTQSYAYGFQKDIEPLFEATRTVYGKERRRFYNLQNVFVGDWNYMDATDTANLVTMIEALTSTTTYTFRPFWFNDDSAQTSQFWMMNISRLPRRYEWAGGALAASSQLVLTEVVKSA